MKLTHEQIAAPEQIRACLMLLRDEYLVNNAGARGLADAALDALKHLEDVFQEHLLKTIQAAPIPPTASTASAVVLQIKSAPVPKKPALQVPVKSKSPVKKKPLIKTFKKLDLRRKKK